MTKSNYRMMDALRAVVWIYSLTFVPAFVLDESAGFQVELAACNCP
jgi:hypothetical protein